MGDFNEAAWSRGANEFKRVGGYVDPRIGRGLYASFHAKHPMIRCPIDQFYATEEVAVVSIELGPRVGSDHLPLIARDPRRAGAGRGTRSTRRSRSTRPRSSASTKSSTLTGGGWTRPGRSDRTRPDGSERVPRPRRGVALGAGLATLAAAALGAVEQVLERAVLAEALDGVGAGGARSRRRGRARRRSATADAGVGPGEAAASCASGAAPGPRPCRGRGSRRGRDLVGEAAVLGQQARRAGRGRGPCGLPSGRGRAAAEGGRASRARAPACHGARAGARASCRRSGSRRRRRGSARARSRGRSRRWRSSARAVGGSEWIGHAGGRGDLADAQRDLVLALGDADRRACPWRATISARRRNGSG